MISQQHDTQTATRLGLPAYVFDYWDTEHVSRWIEQAGDRPEPPMIEGLAVSVMPNHNAANEERRQWDWASALECGKSYLVGDSMRMKQFIESHTTRLIGWKPAVWQWCMDHPAWRLEFNMAGNYWVCAASTGGDYVTFGLPHHGRGGERHWISRDGKNMILVNVD